MLSYFHSLWILISRFFHRVKYSQECFYFGGLYFRIDSSPIFCIFCSFSFSFFAILLHRCLFLFPSIFLLLTVAALSIPLYAGLLWLNSPWLPSRVTLRYLGSAVSSSLNAVFGGLKAQVWGGECSQASGCLGWLVGVLPFMLGSSCFLVVCVLRWFCPPALGHSWGPGAWAAIWQRQSSLSLAVLPLP